MENLLTHTIIISNSSENTQKTNQLVDRGGTQARTGLGGHKMA
jgi:hypothetical protein